jgi:hypothetical protein
VGEDLGARERHVLLDDGRLMPDWVRRLVLGAILFILILWAVTYLLQAVGDFGDDGDVVTVTVQE